LHPLATTTASVKAAFTLSSYALVIVADKKRNGAANDWWAIAAPGTSRAHTDECTDGDCSSTGGCAAHAQIREA